MYSCPCYCGGNFRVCPENQVRENPDKNTVNVAIGQWGTTQNESQNYWNPDNHAVAKGMGGYYFIQTIDGISK